MSNRSDGWGKYPDLSNYPSLGDRIFLLCEISLLAWLMHTIAGRAGLLLLGALASTLMILSLIEITMDKLRGY